MRTPVSSCIDFGPTRYDLIRENNLELVEILKDKLYFSRI
jgi:hypothetical protein